MSRLSSTSVLGRISEEDDGDDVLVWDIGGAMAIQATLDIPEPMAGDLTLEPKNRQQAMKSTEWDAWREAEKSEMRGMIENIVCEQVDRPKDKLVVGTKMVYKRREVQASVDLPLKDSGMLKEYITRRTHPHLRPHIIFGCV